MKIALTILTLFIGLVVCASARAERVSAVIVLAADVSGSIDYGRWKLQRDGYAEAITNPRFLQAVEGTSRRRIAVVFFEWAGAGEQRIVVDWTVIESRADAERIAERLRQNDRAFTGSTSISGALNFAATLLAAAPYEYDRAIVDVSGDGTNSDGSNVDAARDRLLEMDATINGIVIFGPQSEPDLREHYENHVTGGPGSFVMVADDFNIFAYALVAKLIREVAWR